MTSRPRIAAIQPHGPDPERSVGIGGTGGWAMRTVIEVADGSPGTAADAVVAYAATGYVDVVA